MSAVVEAELIGVLLSSGTRRCSRARMWLSYERIDFVGDPVILEQYREHYPGEEQNPTILAPRNERQLKRDVHEVRRAVTDIRQESENDQDQEHGMCLPGRDTQQLNGTKVRPAEHDPQHRHRCQDDIVQNAPGFPVA